MAYVVNPNDPTSPKDTDGATQGAQELRGIKGLIQTLIAGLFIANPVNTNPYGLVNMINPSGTDQGRGIVASGWDFAGRNQQWGGAPAWFELVDSATDQLFKFEAADGYIESDTVTSIGDNAARFYIYQVITPSKNLSMQAFWAKLYKNGNPVDNLTLQLWSVAAGLPNAVIATANLINGKQVSSDTNGQFYRFSFAAIQALVAGTQYILTLSKSGGIDATNFYNWMGKSTTHYPSNLKGSGTVGFAWTPVNTQSSIFLVEPQASDQVLQSGGVFDWQLAGYASNPLNRMGALNCSLQNLKWNYRKGTVLIRGNSFGKGFPFFDATYGLHHDRLVAITNPISGVGNLTILDRNGVATTISGVTDLSTIQHKDISLEYRAMNDGGDYLRFRVNGVVEGQILGQSFNMDPLWILGTAWLMGGFQLLTTASYTQYNDMTALPSTAGWTFAGADGEAAGWSVANGKLYQNKDGVTGVNTSTYTKAAAGFNNVNGSILTTKLRVVNAINIFTNQYISIDLSDGARRLVTAMHEYYQDTLVGLIALPQVDNKSAEFVYTLLMKGNDFYSFYDGKLIIDGSGFSTSVTANNQVIMGDNATSGNHADAIWDYIGYITSNLGFPQFSSCKISQFAYFQEDASAIMGNLYNAGLPISVKAYCGIGKNWVGEAVVTRQVQKGITPGPTTTSTTGVIQPEMEMFLVGREFDTNWFATAVNSATNALLYDIRIDGAPSSDSISQNVDIAGTGAASAISRRNKTYFGLHKIEAYWAVNGATGTLNAVQRRLDAEIRV